MKMSLSFTCCWQVLPVFLRNLRKSKLMIIFDKISAQFFVIFSSVFTYFCKQIFTKLRKWYSIFAKRKFSFNPTNKTILADPSFLGYVSPNINLSLKGRIEKFSACKMMTNKLMKQGMDLKLVVIPLFLMRAITRILSWIWSERWWKQWAGWRLMRPKARWLAQHGGPPDWLTR